MFMFRPGLADVAWQILYDGLLEDVPQFTMQLIFLKTISRTGSSWLQLCSQLLSAAGASVMCLRAINLGINIRSRRFVVPEENRQRTPPQPTSDRQWVRVTGTAIGDLDGSTIAFGAPL